MQADYAQKFPVLMFASGPTNSMRGAAFLSGVQEALVLDIGGTTSDVGALRHGFPRETAVSASFAGVRTNFRMPDLFSLGLRGGSRVRQEDGNVEIGPDSVGSAIRCRAGARERSLTMKLQTPLVPRSPRSAANWTRSMRPIV